MKFALILILPLLLSACGSQLRSHFCEHPLTEFPASMFGTFTVTIPKADLGTNNATTFEQQTFEITKEGIRYSEFPSVAVNMSGGIGGERMCLINGQVYAEKLNANSTYTVTKFEVTEYGMAMSELGFSVQDLKRDQIPFVVVPDLHISEGADTFWTYDPAIGAQPVIVDNTNVSPEHLVKISKRASLYVAFSRLPHSIVGPMKFVSLKQFAAGNLR